MFRKKDLNQSYLLYSNNMLYNKEKTYVTYPRFLIKIIKIPKYLFVNRLWSKSISIYKHPFIFITGK